MPIRTVAILSPGDMGSSVGRDLAARGFRIVTCLAGRSARTHTLAADAGFEILPSLDEIVRVADLILSIMPPAAALDSAGDVAAAMRKVGTVTTFVDCNAVSPDTARRIGDILATAQAPYIDAGIVGYGPGKGEIATRFYCAGPDTVPLEALHGGGIDVRPLGREIGRASALKMTFAAMTKGAWTLYAASLLAAERLALSETLHAELAASRPQQFAEMQRMVPRLPLDAARWVAEMHEIAATLGSAGVSRKFHEGAAETMDFLTRTTIAAETRETVDPNRTLKQALEVFARAMPDRDAAE